MMVVGLLVMGLLGLLLLLYRMTPRREPLPVAAPSTRTSSRSSTLSRSVSIIVPARNEARRLPQLLASLAKLDPPPLEIIVVDDRSEDDTAELASALGASVVHGQPRPVGWFGKQWACAQGARVAKGEVLLFTDADTEHRPDSLARAVSFLRAQNAAMISCLPFHQGRTWWEALLGPFHVMLLAVTAPYGAPKLGRVYAIGQYLMFTRAGYAALGGHGAVRGEFVEDLPLAHACLRSGLVYRVYRGPPLYRVSMYEDLPDLVSGWRRNFRAGLHASSRWAAAEMALMIGALTGGGMFFATWWSTALMLTTVVVLLWTQRALGTFSIWGPLLFPLSIALLCLVTALAVFDIVGRRELRWRGRAYAPPQAPRPAPSRP